MDNKRKANIPSSAGAGTPKTKRFKYFIVYNLKFGIL